ncbi:MAG: hypothetical protein CR996_01355 [Draconibacterium sp.]|nr:MAG: hypothetical protein CR996_01355 [Draconibacterium sp.]PIF05557.1 MAG: hypothetical protein CSA36_06070 [Draconibacterium sp.]
MGISESSTVKFYCFYYKVTDIPICDELYVPVMAGNSLQKADSRFTGDDTGDSISEENPYYSELTGIYWVWKNTCQDIVGSCHYRRYFTAKRIPFIYKLKLIASLRINKKKAGFISTNNINLFRKRLLSRSEIIEILQEYDAILPVRRQFRYSVREHYHKYHNQTDLVIVEEIIRKKFPAYIQSFQNTINNNWLYTNNIFVLKKDQFNALMNWLFAILFAFKERIDLNNYRDYQSRVFGFMSERLITVWFNHYNLKIKELPVIYFKKLKFDT